MSYNIKTGRRICLSILVADANRVKSSLSGSRKKRENSAKTEISMKSEMWKSKDKASYRQTDKVKYKDKVY